MNMVLMLMIYGVVTFIALGISVWLQKHFSSSLVVNSKQNTTEPITAITVKQKSHKSHKRAA